MPKPTIHWNRNADGDWATSADWTPHRLPDATDNVLINTADLHTITHSTGTDTVKTLTVGNDDFVVSGGSLTIKSTSSFANLLAVSGGTLALGGDATVASFTQDGGVVSGSKTLTVTGAASFTPVAGHYSYSLQTGSGTTVLEGVASFPANLPSAVLFLDGGRTLENRGTLNLPQFGEIDLGHNPFGVTLGGAALKNDAGATLVLGGASYIAHGKGAVSFTNTGTIVEQASGSGATVGVSLSNTGQVLAKSGELALFGFTNSGAGTASVSAGGGLVVFDGGSANAAAFSVASGGYLDFFSDRLGISKTGGVFSLGGGTIGGSGTVSVLGPGELALGPGEVTIATFQQSYGTVSGSGTLTLTGQQVGLSALESGPGVTLLEASSTFALGLLNLDGGRIVENHGATGTIGDIVLGRNPSGHTLGGGTLKNDAGGSLSFTGAIQITAGAGADSFINAGTIEKFHIVEDENPPDHTVAVIGVNFTNTGTITIEGGILEFTGASNSFTGSISTIANGFSDQVLAFAGGTSVLNRGLTVTVPKLTLSNGAVVDLNESLGFSGAFAETDAGTTLNVAAGDTLTLTGAASLGGTVSGGGTVDVSSATSSGFTLGGATTLNDQGTVVQSGLVILGDASLAAATLSIASGALLNLESGAGIGRGNSLASSIVNAGLLTSSAGAGGISVIGAAITNAGTIEAASGTLDLTQAITGRGSLAVDAGATLEVGFSAASSLTATFKGGGATLALGNPAQFAATIAGFAATDTIQLVARAATSATLGAGDKLVIANGSKIVATLQLSGNFAGDSFHVASDGAGGSLITVSTPGAATKPAAPGIPGAGHAFIAAMAGIGAGGGGPSAAMSPAHADAYRPSLSTPGLAHLA